MYGEDFDGYDDDGDDEVAYEDEVVESETYIDVEDTVTETVETTVTTWGDADDTEHGASW